MSKYIVKTSWSGYSRGTAVYEVYAESAQEAEDNWFDGTLIEKTTVRDDTETQVDLVTAA